ncbi:MULTISPECIES: TnsA-like heteromeric transposase endonuclease subunit [Nocardia]|uniref:TnsA-like heteromeric transposase endonuclease subunit n=1 Tax=Nocardia TaxID=1817 RepID=UPI001D0C0330|nr:MULTISPECIES: TnsA-like heteromeric transposase endonuclease subunit [Nocardia]
MIENPSVRVVLTGLSPDSAVSVRYRGSDGRFVETNLRRLPVDEVLTGLPVREFRAWRGRRHYSGWYWSATTGSHVVYESRLELARILLADRDPDVVAIAAQPFLMTESVDGRVHRHVPDLLLAHRDGSLTVVDVKAAERLSVSSVREQFEWTRQVCRAHGFGFEVWSGADRVFVENVRFLAGYRRPSCVADSVVAAVLDAVSAPMKIADLERRLSGFASPLLVRPAILHLLWRSRLTADLSRVLDGAAIVAAGVVA